MAKTSMEKRLRIASVLVALGLLAELGSLLWSHPTAFIFFLIGGGLLIGIGVLFYLYSLVSTGEAAAQTEPEEVADNGN
ncbi:MAG: hypothetical protein L0229_13405 [Blastocatellia bacterium]|nr:hypothetical protein [Blastocatellia bacterium]